MKLRETLLLLATTLAAVAQSVSVPTTNHWRAFTKADGLPENACISVTIGAGGNVLVRHAKANTVTVLDGYEITSVPVPGTNYNRVYESPSGQLWIVAHEGLQEFRDGEWVLHRVPEIAKHFRAGNADTIPLCPVRQGHVVFLLADRLMQLDADEPDNLQTVLLRSADQTRLGQFTALRRARDGGLWISGTRGVAKIPGPLRSLKPDSTWDELVPPADLQIQNFRAVQENQTGGLITLVESASSPVPLLARHDGHSWSVQPLNVEKLSFAWRSSADKTWIATSDSLYEMRSDRTTVVTDDEIPVRRIFDVAVEPSGAFWLATSDGLFRHAPAIWQSEGAAGGSSAAELDVLPGEKTVDSIALAETSITDPGGKSPPVTAGVVPDAAIPLLAGATPRGEWETRLTARNGDLWLGGAHEIAWRHQNSWRIFSSTNQFGPQDVVVFAEAPDGHVWCATPHAVWEFDGKNWVVLRGGFDRINGLCGARDGTLWVATDNGEHRYAQGAWIGNGPEDGLPSAVVRAVSENKFGRITAITARGASGFRPEADTDPPKTFIRPTADADQTFREGTPVTLSFTGHDKWKFTAANRLLFSYRLDEREWSPFQELPEISFADLPVGKHYFQARAMDRNGNIDPKPARLEFVVALPWYRETRLVLILTIALVVALFFAGVAVNRHRLLLRSYAVVEEQVAARTRELELANRELLQSQKMNALGTLAAGIAHDFNNILSIIKGSTQIIEENAGNPEKIRTRADRIKTVVEQGAGVVQAMLGFSRGSDEQLAPCDLNAVVDDTLKLLGDRFRREVEVRFDRAPSLPDFPAAKNLIQQILLNFIFNAAESMERRSPDRLESGATNHQRADREIGVPASPSHQHKQVILTTRPMDKLPADLVLLPAKAASYVSISVRDSGGGITPENLPRIFEPFFTTKALSTRRGTGLGLSMVYELAKKMAAGLAVESIVNQGSTFTLILPMHDFPPSPKGAADDSSSITRQP